MSKVKLTPTLKAVVALARKYSGSDYTGDVLADLERLLEAEFKRGAIAGAKDMRDTVRMDIDDTLERIKAEY